MLRVTFTWRNDNPDTIWNRLTARLGREPTDMEAAAEVRRILDEAAVDRAMTGNLAYQRRA